MFTQQIKIDKVIYPYDRINETLPINKNSNYT